MYKVKLDGYESLVKLCTDICQRNGKKKLLWFADKTKTLNYTPKVDEMVLTVHRWFANKSCPGDWLYSRLGDLAAKVTDALGSAPTEADPAPEPAKAELYRVRKTWSDAKSQKGAYKILANAKKCAEPIRATVCLTARALWSTRKTTGSILLSTAIPFGRLPRSISVMVPGLRRSSV